MMITSGILTGRNHRAQHIASFHRALPEFVVFALLGSATSPLTIERKKKQNFLNFLVMAD
jgi:hypothetical protein